MTWVQWNVTAENSMVLGEMLKTFPCIIVEEKWCRRDWDILVPEDLLENFKEWCQENAVSAWRGKVKL